MNMTKNHLTKKQLQFEFIKPTKLTTLFNVTTLIMYITVKKKKKLAC